MPAISSNIYIYIVSLAYLNKITKQKQKTKEIHLNFLGKSIYYYTV